MKKVKGFPIQLSFFLLVLCHSSKAQVMWQASGEKVIQWHYNDGDEFTGKELDTSKWNNTYPWGRTLYCNREQQYYTDNANIELEKGILNLVVRKEPVTAKVLHWESDTSPLLCNDKEVGKNLKPFEFTSAMIYSTKKYHYGYYEIKFKSDEGKGLWPAFWLYAGHDNDEIDIFELKGERNSEFHVDVHCPKGCNNYKTTLGLLKKNWGDYLKTSSAWHTGFNIIGLEWTPDYIKWYLNGRGVAYWKGKMAYPAAVIANLALPSNDGPFGPGPDATTKFPASFEIDFIRIWSSQPVTQSEVFLEPVLKGSEKTLLPNGNSQLIKKAKPEFNKSALKNETTNITFAAYENGGFLVAVNGKPKNGFAIEVKDALQKVIYKSNDPNMMEHHFYLPKSKGNASMEIRVNGQKIEHRF
ncbi:MAG: glycoside hydrolase family 16 protein [Bacteroidetes bacterium]|nr:glycoside hydrolase family 16 protein [Bacteroidota bacterium]